jgi:AcrR family transcriptional regulator
MKIYLTMLLLETSLNYLQNREQSVGIEERRQRERDEVRERILDAARELFVECGFEGVTMRKVAERIEYSPTTIYIHFADKEALFRELCGADFAQLAAAFQKLAVILDPLERLRACAIEYIQFAVDHPNHYRLMFLTPNPTAPCKEDISERKGNPNEDAYAFLYAIVSAAIDAGLFRSDLNDPHLICQTLWAAVHGIASLEITNKNDAWVCWASLEERAQTMLNGILFGLLQPSALQEKE